MDLIGCALHSIRKGREIGLDSAGDRISAILFGPTIVQDHIFVAGIFESKVDYGVGSLHDLGLVDITEVRVLSICISGVASRDHMVVHQPMSSNPTLVVYQRHQEGQVHARAEAQAA